MLVLVDTNVLLRVIEPLHPHHEVAANALRALRAKGDELCVVPQIHYEIWAVATRPIAQNGLGMSPADAEVELLRLAPPLFRLLRDERAIYDHWRGLVNNYQVVGKRVHDARLVAAMERHGVTGLLTFNIDDFKAFSGITLLEPASIDSKASR